MERQCIGLSPQCVEMILQTEMISETKLVLIAMFQRGVSKAYFADLREQLFCSTLDLEMARLQLTTLKICKATNQFSCFELTDKWTKLLEENKDVCIQSWPTSVSTPAESNREESKTETSIPSDESTPTR